MSLLVPARRFDPAVPEMMDVPGNNPSLLNDDLKNLRTINRFFGGLSAVRSALFPVLETMPPEKTVRILDLATGSADHPIDIALRARRLGRRVHITAVEKNPQTLEIARRRTEGFPEITVERGDILALVYPDTSFDIAICSLAIHHFSRQDALFILRQMKRLSKVCFIVNDLERSWGGAWTAWLYTHLTTRNPLTLNDSYVSVLRAFTANELRELAAEAGVSHFTIRNRPLFRLVLLASQE